MEITNYSISQIKDPTGIIEGERYEFLLDVEVDEDDELYTEGGLELRVILAVEGEEARIAFYNFIDKLSRNALEFALEEDEEAEVLAYCQGKL